MSDQIPFAPKPYDVVCTKLRTWNTKHSGNIFFNELIARMAVSVKEEDMKNMAEQLIKVILEKGGRFLRLSDADTLSGVKPSVCTELDQKQRVLKVLRTLRSAFLKHHGTLTKRVRTPATPRRKKTKTFELHAGAKPIHPYALQLLAAVMNSVKNVQYRELDKPGDPYTIETEPEQLRLMRLQLRHRLVAAKEAMMPPVEFGRTIMNLWGGRIEVQKTSTANAGNSADGDAAATDSVAADAVGSSMISPNNSTSNNNNTPQTANSNMNADDTPTTASAFASAAASPSSEEFQQKKNEMKEQLRVATRQKMKALMNIGGATKASPGRPTKAVRATLASKTLPGEAMNALPDEASKTSPSESTKTSPEKPSRTGVVRGSLASKTLPGEATTTPPSESTQASPGKPTRTGAVRGSLASKTLPDESVATKASPGRQGRPARGSLASKTLPGADEMAVIGSKRTRASSQASASKTSPTKATAARAAAGRTSAKPARGSPRTASVRSSKASSPNKASKDTAQGIGSLVQNLEQADNSPRRKMTRLVHRGVTDSLAAEADDLNNLPGSRRLSR